MLIQVTVFIELIEKLSILDLAANWGGGRAVRRVWRDGKVSSMSLVI